MSDAAAALVPPLEREFERELGPHEASDTERLERLLEQLGDVDGYTVKLERVKSAGVPLELCGHLPALPFGDDFLEDVRQEYGGGKYRGRVYDRRGDYKVGFTFTIAGAARAPRDSNGPAGLVGVGPGSAVSAPQLDRLERLLEKVTELIAAHYTAPAAAAAPRSADEDLERLLKIARAMKELAPAAPPVSAASSPIDTVRTFLELRELLESAGGQGGPSDMSALIEGGVKPIAQLMTRSLDLQEKNLVARQERERRAAGAQSPASPAARHLPSGADAAPGTRASDTAPRVLELPVERVREAGPDQDVALVRGMLADVPIFARMYLATQARMDRDPSAYAVVVLDTIQQSNAAAYEALPELLTRPDFLDIMLECVPEWRGARPWFAELVAEMRAILADDQEDAASRDAEDVSRRAEELEALEQREDLDEPDVGEEQRA